MHLETAPAPPEGAPGTHEPGRAGRNLPVAIAVGLTLVALIVVPLYTYRPAFVAVIVAAAWIGVWELVQAIRRLGAEPPLLPLLAGAAAMVVGAYAEGAEFLVVGLILTVIASFVWRLADSNEGYLRDVTATALVAVYVPFLAGFAALLTAEDEGPKRVTILVATVAASDIGGYAAGVLFGKHKMAPTISPKKSWEGFAGSVLACAVVGAVLCLTLLDTEIWQGAVFGLAIVVVATLGDLGESMIKRDIGIKDMGTLLPGHGGIMDRLDSLLPTAPIAYLLLKAFVG